MLSSPQMQSHIEGAAIRASRIAKEYLGDESYQADYEKIDSSYPARTNHKPFAGAASLTSDRRRSFHLFSKVSKLILCSPKATN